MAGGVIYSGISNIGDSSDSNWLGAVIALDRMTGRTIWMHYLPEPYLNYDAPVVAYGTVYVIGQWSVYALSATTGRPRWIYTTGTLKYGSSLIVGSS
jgi:outer membrane protein assembly factor BamB